jgi:hypothetical protein
MPVYDRVRVVFVEHLRNTGKSVVSSTNETISSGSCDAQGGRVFHGGRGVGYTVPPELRWWCTYAFIPDNVHLCIATKDGEVAPVPSPTGEAAAETGGRWYTKPVGNLVVIFRARYHPMTVVSGIHAAHPHGRSIAPGSTPFTAAVPRRCRARVGLSVTSPSL